MFDKPLRSSHSTAAPATDLGSGRFTIEDTGIPLMRGDDLISDKKIDFIKLDVEEMEMQVLEGLEKTIQSSRPTIFVEVDNNNLEAFAKWVERNNYKKSEEYRRYDVNTNFLIEPRL